VVDRENPDGGAEIPGCPICGSHLAVPFELAKLKICVCRECGTSLSIPDEAWDRVKMLKRERV